MKNLFSLTLANQLLGAIVLTCSVHGFAQTETDKDELDPYLDWYQVELIIFKNLDANARHQEQWPTQKELNLSEDTQSLNELLAIPLPAAMQAIKEAGELALLQLEQELAEQTLFEQQSELTEEAAIDTTVALVKPELVVEEPLIESATEKLSEQDNLLIAEDELEPVITFIPAAENQLVLGHQAQQLKYNKKYQIIYHGGWQQQLSDGQAMTSYRLSVEADGNELDGTINIIRKRFLHVTTDLWMHELAIDTAEINTTVIEENISTFGDANTLVIEVKTDTANDDAVDVIEYARLYKKERMKSNDLHYIDHPLMGMLIKITPFDELTPVLNTIDGSEAVDRVETIEETE
jgi:hypothetical protein